MLTDSRIRAAKPEAKAYKLTDAKGLHLYVPPTGAKSWRYRFELAATAADTIAGAKKVEGVFTIGSYCVAPTAETKEQGILRRAGGEFTLAEARTARDNARALVKQGINPTTQRNQDALVARNAREQTFESVAREWVDMRASVKEWEEVTKDRRINLLERLAFPRIGKLPMFQVTSAHVFDLLKRALKTNGPSVKEELQRTLTGIVALAVSTGRADRDVVAPVINGGQLPTHRSEHKVALTVEEVGQLMRDMATRNSLVLLPAAFKLMWFTLVRPVEACSARWCDIDLEKAVWSIPAEKMKMRKAYSTPLSTQAVTMLRGLKAVTGHRVHVFPGRDDPTAPMSTASFRQALKTLGWAGKFSPHATRTTGSTLLNGMGYPSDWIERQLAHGEPNKAKATYDHSQHFDNRRDMMQRWADLLDVWQAGGKVMPIRTVRGLAAA